MSNSVSLTDCQGGIIYTKYRIDSVQTLPDPYRQTAARGVRHPTCTLVNNDTCARALEIQEVGESAPSSAFDLLMLSTYQSCKLSNCFVNRTEDGS